jgi:hypothetical protein
MDHCKKQTGTHSDTDAHAAAPARSYLLTGKSGFSLFSFHVSLLLCRIFVFVCVPGDLVPRAASSRNHFLAHYFTITDTQRLCRCDRPLAPIQRHLLILGNTKRDFPNHRLLLASTAKNMTTVKVED